MPQNIREIGFILAAFIVWWAIAVLLGMLMFAIWPAGESYTAGVSLEPQNIPGNVLGFIAALYAFRAVSRKQNRDNKETEG